MSGQKGQTDKNVWSLLSFRSGKKGKKTQTAVISNVFRREFRFSFQPCSSSQKKTKHETKTTAILDPDQTYKRFATSLPGLETLQSLVDISLMKLGHVGVHLRIVVPDVPLGAPVGDSAETKRRGEVVGALELNVEERGLVS